MNSRPGPVPSKNALRALRNLAFGTPALIFGAVGSTCGLIAVECELYRRVRIADKILERKSSVAALANGRHLGRYQRMIELAEKGEDTSIAAFRASMAERRRQKRNSASVATSWQQSQSTDDGVMTQAAGGRIIQYDKAENSRASNRSNQGTIDNDKKAVLEFQGPGGPAPKSHSSLSNAGFSNQSKTASLAYMPIPATPITVTSVSPTYGMSPPAQVLRSWILQTPETEEPSSAQNIDLEALQTKYHQDLRSSSSERVRLATMMQMKAQDYTVYGRKRPKDTVATGLTHGRDLAPRRATNADNEAAVALVTSSDTISDLRQDSSTPRPKSPHSAVSSQLERPRERELPMEPNMFASWPGIEFEFSGSERSDKTFNPTQLDTGEYLLENDVLQMGDLRQTLDEASLTDMFQLAYDQKRSDKAEKEDNIVPSVAIKQPELDTLCDEENRAVEGGWWDIYVEARAAPPPSLGRESSPESIRLLCETEPKAYATSWAEISNRPTQPQRAIALAVKLYDLMCGGTEQKINLAELLFHALFRSHGEAGDLRPVPSGALLLADNLFARKLPERAGAVLFPYSKADAERFLLDNSEHTMAKLLYTSASQYVKMSCQSLRAVDAIRGRVAQMLQVAKSMDMPLLGYGADLVLLPAIRRLISLGYAKQAGQLLAGFRHEHNIPFKQLLACCNALCEGYASGDHEIELKAMFDALHTDGLSRSHALWFSSVFTKVFQEHLRRNTLAESYDLLVHALAYWGLMPDPRVSSAIISACLHGRRYDCIQEYVQAIRQLYKFLDLGLKNALSCWQISKTWKEMRATCEDIQKGCLAMAYCADDEPFGPDLRKAAEEAVRRDIIRRLTTLYTMNHTQHSPIAIKNLRNLGFEQLIEEAHVVAAQPGPSTKLYLNERARLLEQVKYVIRLNRLFGGDHMGDDIEPSQRSKSSLREQSAESAYQDSEFAAKIFEDPQMLPERHELWKLLAMHYANRKRLGLPVEHELLQHVVTELIRQQRAIGSEQIIAAVWQSPFALSKEGTSFTEELFYTWFDIGVRLRSSAAMRDALWAYTEADNDIHVSMPFIVRVERHYLELKTGDIAKHRARMPQQHVKEIAYLISTLKRRYERQMGVSLDEDEQLWNEYKSWDEWTVEMPEEIEDELQSQDMSESVNEHDDGVPEMKAAISGSA